MFQINGYVINVDDYSITYDYDGVDILEFDIDTHNENYGQVKERAVINDNTNNYVITKIDGNSSRYVHVTAEVDRRAFQAVFYENFENESELLTTAITTAHTIGGVSVPAILPSGWTFVNNGNTTDYRTLRLEHGTALDLLNNCAALYKVRFNFDAKNKVLRAVNPDGYTLGAAFVTEQFNLRSLQYFGNASEFVTRLEARGKDGLTFKNQQVHGQTITTSYVENHDYSDDIIYGYWQDERYTDVESLYDDAAAKLREMANPVRSYECDVIDLKAIDPDKYSAFDLSLYQKVSLKDIQRGTATEYQVVKYKVYPHWPEKNVVTLSTNPPSISQKLTDIEETAIEASEAAVEASKEAKNATSWMTDSANGRIYFIRDNDGNITHMVLKVGNGNNPPVWVFNANGIGYSEGGITGTPIVSMTADGAVKAINSFTLVDSDNTTRGSIEYSEGSGATLYLYNSDGINVATVQQGPIGGTVAIGNKNSKQVASMGIGEDLDGVINVCDSNGDGTINLSGQTGHISCVSLTQTSSRKIKCNIKPIQDAEKILELKAVSFDYKNSSLGTNKRGFIAEDVAEILPNLVIPETDETPARLDYIGMIPYLQAVIKEQQAQIEELQETVEGLRRMAMI